MIRINLLPFRLARKKENIRQQISIFLLLVVFSLVALYAATQMVNKKIEAIAQETKQVDLRIKTFKEKATRVKKIKSDLKRLEEKLVVVEDLQIQKDRQYVLFDTMTQLVIPGRMWLENLKITDTSVEIKGIAFDNPTIAEYMQKLEASPLFTAVDLKTAQMKKIKDDIQLKSFELLCRKPQPVKIVEKTDKKGRK
jgi:type IV pilus assembly protein PilN